VQDLAEGSCLRWVLHDGLLLRLRRSALGEILLQSMQQDFHDGVWLHPNPNASWLEVEAR